MDDAERGSVAPDLAGNCPSSPVDGGERGPFGAESDTAAAQREAAGFAERGCARPIRPGPARLPNSSQSHRTLPTSLPIGMGLQKNCGSLPFNARDILIMKQFSRRPGPAWAGARGVLPRSGKAGGGAQQRDRPATFPGLPTGRGGAKADQERGRGLGFFGCCWGLPRQVKCL